MGVHLRYTFESGLQSGAALDNPLLEMLKAVTGSGSIRHAAQQLGCSYRHIWGSLKKWEQILGAPLIVWSQGQRGRPTPFAERLLWNERVARIRMQPHIETLRSDLARVLTQAHEDSQLVLRVCASHDMALPLLQQHAAEQAGLRLDLGFQGSTEALRSLNEGQCEVAGFHIPTSCDAASLFARDFKPLLKPKLHRLVKCARRQQGIMVRKEHASAVRRLADLVSAGLRFVNRQPGSGTRLLADQLMKTESIDPTSLPGYEHHIEHTHTAVALCVASGVADAGLGVEAAALQYGLHFIPLVQENYFLACQTRDLERLAVVRLQEILHNPPWRRMLRGLPGYESPNSPGDILNVDDALPWWRTKKEMLSL